MHRCSRIQDDRSLGFGVLLFPFLHLLEGLLQHTLGLGNHVLHLIGCNDLLALQAFRINAVDGRVVADLAINHRLGGFRIIHLIMAVPAVPDQINQEILLEQMAVSAGHTDGSNTGFGVVGIDMHYRDLIALRQITGVMRGAGIFTFGGEADPVIDDNMHSAAILITLQFADIKCFRNNAFTREGGIAMHKHGHGFVRIQLRQAWGAPFLLGCTREAFNDRIHELEMARVVRKRDAGTHSFAFADGAVGA